MNNRVIPLTDHLGKRLLPDEDLTEPLPGSIVLTEGLHGTAWQRHFRDGLWYCTGRVQPVQWDDLLSKRNVVLVYDAEERTAPKRTRPGRHYDRTTEAAQ